MQGMQSDVRRGESAPLSAHTVRRQVERLAIRHRRENGRYGLRAWLQRHEERGLVCLVSEEIPLSCEVGPARLIEPYEVAVTEVNRDYTWGHLMRNRRSLAAVNHMAGVEVAMAHRLAEVQKEREESTAEAVDEIVTLRRAESTGRRR